jgi:hypothetical protein
MTAFDLSTMISGWEVHRFEADRLPWNPKARPARLAIVICYVGRDRRQNGLPGRRELPTGGGASLTTSWWPSDRLGSQFDARFPV